MTDDTLTNFYAALRCNPFDSSLRMILSDAILEHGSTNEDAVLGLRDEDKPLIPLATLDLHAAKLLTVCSFLPGSFAKRFARNVPGLQQMSPKQYSLLWRLVYTYRRQLPKHGPVKDMAKHVNEVTGAAKENVRVTRRTAKKFDNLAPAFKEWEHLVD